MLEERKSKANSLGQLWRNCQWSWHFFINSWLQMVQRLIDQKQEWPHQPSLWRHKTTVAFCSSLHQTKGLKALRGYTFLFPSPKALMRLNVNASEKGPQPCWTRKREQTDAYLQDQRNKLLPGLNLSLQPSQAPGRYHLAGGHCTALCGVQRPERVHSLHVGEQFPPKWLLTNGSLNYRQDWWVCLAR